MTPLFARSETPAKLADSTQQQLSMYALAASAAGVGVLALASTANAKVIYTPAKVKIVQSEGLITFDLNHDGIPDFGLSNVYRQTSSNQVWSLKAVQVKQANEIIEGQPCYRSEFCAAALPKGAKIGLKGQFQQDPGYGLRMIQLAICDSCSNNGPWLNVKQAYLGLKFVIKGKTHFGWAQVKLSHPMYGTINATLTAYAYETIPDKAIVAGATRGTDESDLEQPDAALITPIPDTPQPVTLGTLALGAPGLSIWRRTDCGIRHH
jgi:hypothetical protein